MSILQKFAFKVKVIIMFALRFYQETVRGLAQRPVSNPL